MTKIRNKAIFFRYLPSRLGLKLSLITLLIFNPTLWVQSFAAHTPFTHFHNHPTSEIQTQPHPVGAHKSKDSNFGLSMDFSSLAGDSPEAADDNLNYHGYNPTLTRAAVAYDDAVKLYQSGKIDETEFNNRINIIKGEVSGARDFYGNNYRPEGSDENLRMHNADLKNYDNFLSNLGLAQKRLNGEDMPDYWSGHGTLQHSPDHLGTNELSGITNSLFKDVQFTTDHNVYFRAGKAYEYGENIVVGGLALAVPGFGWGVAYDKAEQAAINWVEIKTGQASDEKTTANQIINDTFGNKGDIIYNTLDMASDLGVGYGAGKKIITGGAKGGTPIIITQNPNYYTGNKNGILYNLGDDVVKSQRTMLKNREFINKLNSPNKRHNISSVTQKSVAKDKNTVISSQVDVDRDIRAIQADKAKINDDSYEINGRTYGVHENGTLYPVSGQGLHHLDRGSYKALGVYNKFGDTPQAHKILDNMRIGKEQRQKALDAFKDK